MSPGITPSSVLISVITVVRNDASGMQRTMDSVFRNAGLPIEYIVVDGASTDDTLSVIHSRIEEIDVLISEPDHGVYDAMNKGAARAQGQWLYFLNAGDVLRQGAFLAMQSALAQYAQANLKQRPDVLTGRVNIVNEQYEDLGYTHPHRPMQMSDLTEGNCVAHQASWIRRDAFLEHGAFRTDLRIMGDYEYWIRLRHAGCVIWWVPDIVADFVRNGMSSRRENVLEAERERLDILVQMGDLTRPQAARQRRWFEFVFGLKSLLRRVLGEGISRKLSLRNLKRGQ